MTRLIDLSGQQPTWPDEALPLWDGCVLAACRVSQRWRVPAPQGDDLLREQLSAVLGVSPELLTITAGIRAAALTYARTDRRIAAERPTFAGVVTALRAAGAEVLLREWPDLLGLELSDADLCWLTSPLRNPDGATLSTSDRDLLQRRIEAGGRVVLNSVYRWYADSAQLTPVPGADLVGTLHKLAGHGARLGWVVSSDYFERAFPEMLGTTPPPPWQHAWGLFLREGGLELLRRATVGAGRAASAAFHERLGRVGDSPHVLLPLAGADEAQALEALSGKGFRLGAGADFHSPGPALRACFTGVGPDEAAAFAEVAIHSGLFAGWS